MTTYATQREAAIVDCQALARGWAYLGSAAKLQPSQRIFAQRKAAEYYATARQMLIGKDDA